MVRTIQTTSLTSAGQFVFGCAAPDTVDCWASRSRAGRDREGCHGAGLCVPALPDVGRAMSTERFLQDLLVALAAANAGEATRLDTRRTGLAGEVARAYNDLVEQNARFSRELARVAQVVGQEGRMTVRVQLGNPTGTWATAVDAVNSLIDDLARPTNEVARVISAVAQGDLTEKMALAIEGRPMKGEFQRIGEVVNSMVDQLRAFADEVTRVAREVGTEGKLGGQATVPGVAGNWKDLTENVNLLAGNLTTQVRNIAQVTTAVAKGDLSQKITVEARGEVAELKNTINTMVDQLSSFADEVTRVAREVGTEGKLGGQAEVKGVSGTWRDLTDSVNSMADNLTDQVRNIAQVTTAVAQGDLSQKITVDARAEILELKNTINKMVDQLSAFAAEVTRVAREVGTEGKLGGQAEVEGASGTWKRLTESVNRLAGNLTSQVRAIAEVATAVTRGDLTRKINVDAVGELADLKDNVNRMIGNLRETTRTNQQQDWLKSNLARLSGLMQGRRDLLGVAQLIMNELTPAVAAQRAAFFLAEREVTGETRLRRIAGYGDAAAGRESVAFGLGESLVGQAAVERRRILVPSTPPGYLQIESGLGHASPASIVIVPVLFEDQVLAVIEMASFTAFSDLHLAFLDQLVETIGV